MKNHESVNDISKRSQRMKCIKKNCSKQIASNKMALNLKSIQKPLKIAAAAGRHHLAHGFCSLTLLRDSQLYASHTQGYYSKLNSYKFKEILICTLEVIITLSLIIVPFSIVSLPMHLG